MKINDWTEQEYRRYQWLRQQFACMSLQMDGTYQPTFRGNPRLKPAKTLDESIDRAIKEEDQGGE